MKRSQQLRWIFGRDLHPSTNTLANSLEPGFWNEQTHSNGGQRIPFCWTRRSGGWFLVRVPDHVVEGQWQGMVDYTDMHKDMWAV